jgi:hypothetical protein
MFIKNKIIMENTLTVEDVYRLIFGIESYFIWDEYDPRGFDEVNLCTRLKIIPDTKSPHCKFKAILDCTSTGCGTVTLHWESEYFDTVAEAILDLGKIFNEGKFIRDTIPTGEEFFAGPESNIPEPDDL